MNDGYGAPSPNATPSPAMSPTATASATATPTASTSTAPAPPPTLPRTDSVSLGVVFALVAAGALLALVGLALMRRGSTR